MRAQSRANFSARFWSKVNKTDGCWLWTDTPRSDGYGAIKTPDSRVDAIAHRVALEMAIGRTLTDDEKACHTCDDHLCVRNDDEGTYDVDGVTYQRFGHLFVGSVLANTRDMLEKGRGAVGERHGMAKLTEADVLEIRAILAAGTMTQSALAIRFGVKDATVSNIVRGKRWAHLL